jgi:hypothetical protein
MDDIKKFLLTCVMVNVITCVQIAKKIPESREHHAKAQGRDEKTKSRKHKTETRD